MLLQIADVASIKNVLKCNIASKIVEMDNAASYGVECIPDYVPEIDKSSAYLWALESGCDIEYSLLCSITAFANDINFNIDECDPATPCQETTVLICGLIVTDISDTITVCTLPQDTIQIIL